MSLLLPESGLIFWMIISFGIVLFALWKWGFPVIIKAVDERKAFIDHDLEAAKQANEQLASLEAKGEAIILQANKEQGRILKEALLERDKILNEARDRAQLAAQKELDDTKKQIQEEKEEAIRDIRKQVAMLSVDIAEKVIREKLNESDEQMELIDRMLNEVLSNRN